MLIEDLRVLDLTDHRGEVGPWLLGRLGAEVIKIEPPGGSTARREPPFVTDAPDGLGSLQFAAYNDNKQSVELDLNTDAGRDAVLKLASGAEIIFDSGPPGYLTSAGISEAELTAVNPELVYVLVTPFGADGPRSGDPASELSIAALGGPMSLQGVRERSPLKVSVPQVWRHTGAEAALASLVGYTRMQRTGEPQWIDVSAQTAMTWTLLNSMEAHEVQGYDFERAGSKVSLALTIDLRRSARDGYVINAPIGATYGPLVPWMIAEGIVDESWADEDWSTYDHRALSGEETAMSYEDMLGALDDLCSRYTREELLMRGIELGATFAPVNSIHDLLNVDHLEVRDFWRPFEVADTGSEVRRAGGPLTVDGERCDQPSNIPISDSSGTKVRSEPVRMRRTSDAGPRDGDLPFAGLKVADFSWIGVGPITAKCFADHGATVVRVETEKRLDTLRAQAPFKDGEFGINRSNFYGSFNTSKLSLGLDLSSAAGLGVARRLAGWADVVIDSFRPGTMERLGLGHEQIRDDNPSVVTITTSLLGGGGPMSSLAGYGFHAAAIAGFTELVGWPDLGPDGPWMAYTDAIAPRFITTAIIAALDRRKRTGQGCHIEAAQLEVGLQLLAPELLDYQINGYLATRLGNRDLHLAPQGAYSCSGEDEWCALTVVDNESWLALQRALDFPEWAASSDLSTLEGRQAHHDIIDDRLTEWTSSRTAEEVERILLGAGIPAGKVQRSRDLVSDPQYLHRDFYKRLEHSEVGVIPYAGHQYKIRDYNHGPRSAAPMLGEHTYEVLSELLGMSPDEIAEAASDGALS
ncbi:MAG: CoA transferase [Actinomycetota bacterium]|nr:CoA transferase [Actinomycetota bacterium]